MHAISLVLLQLFAVVVRAQDDDTPIREFTPLSPSYLEIDIPCDRGDQRVEFRDEPDRSRVHMPVFRPV